MFAGCYAGVLALASCSPILTTWDLDYEESGGYRTYVGVFDNITGDYLSVSGVNNENRPLFILQDATFFRDGVMCKREDLKKGETVQFTVKDGKNAAQSSGVIRVVVVMSLPGGMDRPGDLSPGRWGSPQGGP